MIVFFLGNIVIHPFSLIWVLAGLYTIYLGYQSMEGAQRVVEKDPEPVHQLAPGTVEVTGVARSLEDETVPAHLTDDEALVSEFVLERRRASSRTAQSYTSHWTDLRTVPFEVDDGSGTVRIEPPPDASFVYDEEYDHPSWLRGTPQAVEDLLDRADDIEPLNQGFAPFKYRWTTGVVSPGESVYVRGQAVPADADWGETSVKITGDEDLNEFIISDMEENEIVQKRTRQARQYYVVGIFLLIIGLALAYKPILALL